MAMLTRGRYAHCSCLLWHMKATLVPEKESMTCHDVVQEPCTLAVIAHVVRAELMHGK